MTPVYHVLRSVVKSATLGLMALIVGDKQDVIITTGALGGLGDTALYTTLPRRYSQAGHKVYVDKDNVARNPEIIDLLWGHNRYVRGTSDKKPNAGYINQGKFYHIANALPLGSIEAMERAHGFGPPYSMAPEIHYVPQPFVVDLSQAVLVDFSAVSSTLKTEALAPILPLMQARFQGRQFYMVTFADGVVTQRPPLEGAVIQMNSIYQYVDALASCYAWVGSEAGGQALAAAVRGNHDVYQLDRRPEIVCVASTMTYNSRGYCFRGVDYRVTIHSTNSTADYFVTPGEHRPPETIYERYQALSKRSVEEARALWDAAEAERLARG